MIMIILMIIKHTPAGQILTNYLIHFLLALSFNIIETNWKLNIIPIVLVQNPILLLFFNRKENQNGLHSLELYKYSNHYFAGFGVDHHGS